MTNHLKYFGAKFALLLLLPLLILSGCKKDDDNEEQVGDLSAEIFSSSTYSSVNDTISLVISAKNSGPNASTNVYVVPSALPANLLFVDGGVTHGQYSSKSGKWVIGKLEKDSTALLVLKVKVISTGAISYDAKIYGDAIDNDQTNNKASFSIIVANASQQQKWSYEIYDEMKKIYLWNDALPDTFDPTKYATAEDALEYLIGLKINEDTGQPIDRYSFLDGIGELSGEIDSGIAGDYGFMVAFVMKSDNEVSAFVTYCYPQSPAGKAGITRACELVGINGSDDVHPEVDSEGYLNSGSSAYSRIVNAIFYSSSATFTFKKPDGTTFNASLSTGSYAVNTVLYNSVLSTTGGRKVGYMVYNSFLGNSSIDEIKSTISDFASKGVEYLVVDLRYNGGGSVATCAEFCNQVAPSSANGKVMFKYKMNPYQTAQETEASLTSRFSKKNSFSPQGVYFIVGNGTASASELLINSLKPYFPNSLYLIGTTTYGKPCGFWATPIGYSEDQKRPKEGYDLYAVSFETVNANGEGKYYTGMTPNVTVYDKIGVQWGDVADPRLAQALYHIDNGSFQKSATKSKSMVLKNNIDRQFKGMIDFSHHIKPNTK